MKKLLTIAAVAWALYAVLSPNPPLELPPIASRSAEAVPHPVPSFVLPIVSFSMSGHPFGVASAFVVDRDRGLLMTASHVGVGGRYLIMLPDGRRLPATRVRVNFDVDLALLAVPEGAGPLLPPAAVLAVGPVMRQQELHSVGWRIATVRGIQDIRFRSERQRLWVAQSDASLCDASLGACDHMIRVLVQRLITGYIPNRERSMLYQEYIMLSDGALGDHEVKHGMSGGPVIDRCGTVRGVMSLSSGFNVLIIPTREVINLMR